MRYEAGGGKMDMKADTKRKDVKVQSPNEGKLLLCAKSAIFANLNTF